jgi:uncharacterized membrane protein
MDLIIIFILTLIAFPVVTLTEGVPRIILGVIFLLVFPGYSLIAALFPGKKSINGGLSSLAGCDKMRYFYAKIS